VESADEEGMRSRHVATALVVVTGGLTATAALRRRTNRRLAATFAATTAEPALAMALADRDAVVLPFARPALPSVEERPAAAARCGDSGGRTKAGAPCAARASSGGRCRHHPIAA
jgi:hypothetical protein